MRALGSAALLAVIAGLSAGPSAQSLADAARRASSAPQQAGKKYTNDDVRLANPAAAAPAPAATVADGPTPSATPAGAGNGEGAPAGQAPADADGSDGSEKKPAPYVLNRIAALKTQIESKEKQMRDVQTRGGGPDADKLRTQIGHLQKELGVLESRLATPAPR